MSCQFKMFSKLEFKKNTIFNVQNKPKAQTETKNC